MKTNQKGISHLLLPLIIILVAAVAGTFYMVSSKADQVTSTPRLATPSEQAEANNLGINAKSSVSSAKSNNSTQAVARASGLKRVTIKIKAIQLVHCQKGPGVFIPDQGKYRVYGCWMQQASKVAKSNADLMIRTGPDTTAPAVRCNNFEIRKGNMYNFGNTRTLKCKFLNQQASLVVFLRSTANFYYGRVGSHKYAWPFLQIDNTVPNDPGIAISLFNGEGANNSTSNGKKAVTVHLGSVD